MADYYGNNPAPPKPSMDQGKIFVGGLSWQTTEESLRWHFEQYGRVLSVEVMKNRVTGEPRGFAFVVFTDAATVDLVMAEDTHEINHKIVDVKRAQARGVAPPSIHGGSSTPNAHADNTAAAGPNAAAASPRDSQPDYRSQNNNYNNNNNNQPTPEQLQNKVFVGGIPPHVDKEELRQFFEQFGPVVDAVVMLDQTTNRSRGFGFVTFEHGSEGAKKSVAEQPVQMHGRLVEVKLATPRAEQKRVLPAGSKHVGLRAGQISSSAAAAAGEFAGLAVAYGRNGWKAGYGSRAFGSAGWAVQGWEDGNTDATGGVEGGDGVGPERAGFSFELLQPQQRGGSVVVGSTEPPLKRSRVER